MNSETILYNEIGKKIKKKRKELNITQERLADLTHFSDSFIANIESKTHQTFSISSLNTIAIALNCNIQDLLPTKTIIPEDTNILKCEYCNYIIEIPLEIHKLIKNIEEINNQKLKLTCPKCGRKKM